MEVGDIRFYVERWKAVEEIERQELRALTPKQNWKHLNSIMRRAKRLGIRRGDDDGEMEVILRWAIIKERYESRRSPSQGPGRHSHHRG